MRFFHLREQSCELYVAPLLSAIVPTAVELLASSGKQLRDVVLSHTQSLLFKY